MLSAAGAVWLAINQSNDDRLLREKSDEIATLAKENAALNKEIVSLLTGGDSYCYLLPGFNAAAARRGRPDIWVFHGGKYPLYDVRIRVVDVRKFREVIGDSPPPIPEEKLAPAEKIYDPIPRLDAGFSIRIDTWKFPDGVDKQDYNIFITAHNGMLTQFIRFRWVDGRWHMALQVLRGAEILKELGTQWLSKDETGSPKWD